MNQVYLNSTLLRTLFLSVMLSLACITVEAQSSTQIDYFPSTDIYFAGVSVYNTSSGEYNQYFVEDKKWVKNTAIPQPNISVPKGNLRIEFLPGNKKTLPGMMIYDVKSTSFEMLYLQEGMWKKNENMPQPNFSIKRDIQIKYFPATLATYAYIVASSPSTGEFEILNLVNGKWMKSEAFPTKTNF